MKYALGNMLNGAGSINPDGLALDLQFAADKTLTARRGPTPVLTRGSTGTFVGSNGLIQSAAINAPRFDHDPVTLASMGLLIEETRQNLVLQSENHPSTSWSKTGLTISAVTQTAPDGNTNSNLVSEDSSTGLHRLFQSTAYVSGTSYAISVFLKFAGRQFVAVTHPAVATNNIAIFDIQNGSVTLQQSGITASMIQYPNGWWRCVVNGVSSITVSSSHIIQGSTTGGSLTGSYTGLNGAAFYIYGSQVEAGSFATSYIPTTTSALTRSADVCSITGANFTNLWNTAGGTFLFEGVLPNAPNLNNRYLLSSGGTRRWAYGNSAGQGGILETIAAFDGSTTPNYFTNVRLTTKFKLAISVEALACRASFNGSTVISISHNGNLLNSVTLLALCEGGAGTITGVRYYRKNLPNAKLQAITV